MSFLLPGLSVGATGKQWEVLDLSFSHAWSGEDPFSEEFGAVFRHAQGAALRVPGFYDGDGRWVLRFCPPAAGAWSYTTYATLSELAGKQGTLQVAPAEAHRRGPLRIDPTTPNRLSYQDATPYRALAFELDWLFALDYDSAEGLPRTRQILGEVAANGFNQVVMNVFAYDANWGEREAILPEHNFARPKAFPFGGSNEAPDHATLNVAFFQHLDRVLAALDEEGLIAHLMIYVWNKQVNWPTPGSADDNRYFDYVVKRYQAYPNLLWDISKEALAYGRDDLDYITERIDRLKRLDAHGRLVTVHDYTYCRAHPDKVDIIAIQEWQPNLYDAMRTVAQRHPRKPVHNIEHGGYEKTRHSIFNGAYTDPVACLYRNYLCAFAGIYSTYYWQSTSWYEVVWNPGSLPEAEQPRFSYYKHFAQFLEQIRFEVMQPVQHFFGSYALTNGLNQIAYLIPADMVAIEGMAPPETFGQRVRVSWFDPLTGETLVSEERDIPEDGWTGFRRPEGFGEAFVIALLDVL